MHSGFAAAVHETLGGICVDHDGSGFEKFTLRPCFLPGLQWAIVSLETPQGLIHSSWKRQGDTVSWQIKIPPGSTASVDLPGDAADQIKVDGEPASSKRFSLSAGDHRIVVQQDERKEG